MKFFFNIFFFFFLSQASLGKDFQAEYEIKNRGIKIGLLKWELIINKDTYSTQIFLKNKGFLSKLYSFKGEYVVHGAIEGGEFFSKQYYQYWKTKKKEKVVEIIYKNMRVSKIIIIPKEKESARIDYKKLQGYSDPITSFLNVVFNKKSSYTIDGRRVYLLSPKDSGGGVKILIAKYKNIWADHKRNDLEYIEFFLDDGVYFPKTINIMFRGSVFSLKKI